MAAKPAPDNEVNKRPVEPPGGAMLRRLPSMLQRERGSIPAAGHLAAKPSTGWPRDAPSKPGRCLGIQPRNRGGGATDIRDLLRTEEGFGGNYSATAGRIRASPRR